MWSYIYVDDGYPESDEYDNNYFIYKLKDPQDYKRALLEAKELREHCAMNRARRLHTRTHKNRFLIRCAFLYRKGKFKHELCGKRSVGVSPLV